MMMTIMVAHQLQYFADIHLTIKTKGINRPFVFFVNIATEILSKAINKGF